MAKKVGLAAAPHALPPVPEPLAYQNHILAALPADEIHELRSHLTRVRMVLGQILLERDEQIEHAFFVEDGFVSMVAQLDHGATGVEIGLIGRESMVGLTALLSGTPVSFNCAMVQMPGTAQRIPVAALRACLEQMPALHRRLRRAFELEVAQTAQTAACNARHAIPERCARWLLLAQDRLGTDELALTQEFLSMMLAVRRPGVTTALGTLQAAGLIRTHQGAIAIVDRRGLEAAACECYGRIAAYEAKLAVLDAESR